MILVIENYHWNGGFWFLVIILSWACPLIGIFGVLGYFDFHTSYLKGTVAVERSRNGEEVGVVGEGGVVWVLFVVGKVKNSG